MSRLKLIIDKPVHIVKPKNCDECPLFQRKGTEKECWIHDQISRTEFRIDPKPDWCQLEKIEIHTKSKDNEAKKKAIDGMVFKRHT